MGTLRGATRNGKRTAKPRARAAAPDPRTAKLAIALREHKQAIEQQAATAEILRIIADSTESATPVFEAITRAGLRLMPDCRVALFLLRDGQLHYMSHSGIADAERALRAKRFPMTLDRGLVGGAAILDRRMIHVPDIQGIKGRYPISDTLARESKFRALLCLPLVSRGKAIGALSLGRVLPGPFTKKQIALARTFADQATIAIQNARQFNETKEALEQQTATADILGVISRSPTNIEPVLRAVAENAARLCEATDVHIRLVRGDLMPPVVQVGSIPIDKDRARMQHITAETVPGRAILECKTIHIHDVMHPHVRKEYPQSVFLKRREPGFRTILVVPLVRDGAAIGTITVRRSQVRPFPDRQIKLLQTFADQAVIAIENARLFNETKEALERQTSISEVLAVISSSPTKLAPILDAVASRAAKLCDATDARIFLVDGREVRHVAGFGDLPVRTPVFELNPGTSVGTAILKGQPVHVRDIEVEADKYPLSREIARKAGWRTSLNVPLMRERKALGAISLRRRDVRPFTDRQIALLKVFADQAAIAIENARLFNETKESLEKQTATADILQVLSGSPSDTQPVFDAIVRHAARLCESTYANVFRYDGAQLHLAASEGVPDDVLLSLKRDYPMAPDRSRVVGRVIREARVVHIEDTRADLEYDKAYAGAMGHRRILGVPLVRGGRPVGAIAVAWTQPGPILPRHEDLLKTFADQAVIAIENVRLFNETKEALERQTATADILKVISSSPTDTRPVLDAIAQSAAQLFAPCNVGITMLEDNQLHLRAMAGPRVAQISLQEVAKVYPLPFDPATVASAKAILERRVLEFTDMESEHTSPVTRKLAPIGQFKSAVIVPLIRENVGIGTIAITHPEPGFRLDEKQLALLKTFADQAVIAIENVRLFNETKEALEQQTATAEILKVISGSPTDVQPVFDAIVVGVSRLFGRKAALRTVEADGLRRRARSYEPEPGEYHGRDVEALDRRSIVGQAVLEGRALQWRDTLVEGAAIYGLEEARKLAFRSIASAPLMRVGRAIGVISVSSPTPGLLTASQMELLTTFADQAVIAIENVRLFNETKEALERETATAEVLKVISASPTDVAPVFDAILRSAVTLCGAELAAVFPFDGKLVHLGATHNWPPAALQYFSKIYPSPPSSSLLSGRTILSRSLVEIADAAADEHYDPDSVATGHWRRMLGAPMLREGRPLGALVVAWRNPGETPRRQVELLQTFADQAAIAIENVRLFNETKEALEQQTAISDILRVISSSPEDLGPVFEAILSHAIALCEGSRAVLWQFDGKHLHFAAHKNGSPEGVAYLKENPLEPGSYNATPRAVLERRAIHIVDAFAEPGYRPLIPSGELPDSPKTPTVLAVPLLRDEDVLGVITIWRDEVRPFSEKQIATVSTFAAQAVIAIGNVRLFNETKEALDQQKASAEVLGAISGSIADTKPVFEKILASCERLFEGELVGITLADGDTVRLIAYHGPQGEQLKKVYPLPLTRESGTGWAILNAKIAHFPDIEAAGVPPGVVAGSRTLRVRAIVFAPMLFEGKGIGAIWVARAQPGVFTDKQIAQLRTFADQAVIAIQNARLFREIQEKSAQLEVANKHKSDFLANMSHELRTPLNAIIGFSEVLSERMFGEVNEKQAEYLKDIHESGRHLLSLINDILDLSKIEAGRMELELSSFDLPSAVSNAMTLVRERAQRHGIHLGLEMDPGLGELQADERKVKQILLNLLSNAVKFTPDGGKVDVSTRKVDGRIEIAVRDTGIGIAPEDHAAVFEEFKQVGRDYTRKAEGTGLGLALTKRLVELHGGEISLESALGKGATFTVKLPLR